MADRTMDASLSEYFAECGEISQRIAEHLRTAEKGAVGADVIDALYRDIHTLKGTSQLFGFIQMGELAHAMENHLDPIRRGGLSLGAQTIDYMMRGLDLIDQMLADIRAQGKEVINPAVATLITTISGQAAAPAAPPVQPAVPVLAVAPPPAEAAPVAAPTAAPPTSAAPAAAEAPEVNQSIRVPVTLLDRLMNLMGEMVLVRNQVLQYASKSDHLEFVNLSQRLDVVTSEIQGEVMKTRMQPIGTILTKFHRVTRDLARDLNKKIDLELIGIETELDKTLLEAVRDPVVHIVRNSCDHGLEGPDERRAAGKPAGGKVTIRSFHEGGHVIVEISDDGRGLNEKKLIAKAIEKKLITPEQGAALSQREAFALIFAPGFSTAAAVTNVSGRGVGMDVVKTNIESIGGIVEIQSELGRGTTTRLKIPLTLAIVPAMIVRLGLERFAIPQVKLVELVRVGAEESHTSIERVQGKPVFRLRGQILPLVTLTEVLGLDGAAAPADDVTNVVVLNAEGVLFGLIVDEVQDTAEVVVKPISAFFKSLLIYSGATVLGDGSVAVILDIGGIAQKFELNQRERAKVIEAAHVHSDVQEFLLFELNTPTRHAIPLHLVHRLEEFPAASVEISGESRFVRYRGLALPIFSLNEILGFPGERGDGPLSVIVTQKGDHFYGIEVNQIFDVMTTTNQVDHAFASAKGIYGNLVTDDELVVIVDTIAILEQLTRALTGDAGPAPVASTAHVKRTGRVLYAEDTAFFRRFVSGALERAGFQVDQAHNGREALEMVEKAAPGHWDVILSDIEMPKMNGLQFAAAVRQLERWKTVPLIALTTKTAAQDLSDGNRAGFDEYLEKLNLEVLLAALDRRIAGDKKQVA